MVTTRWLRPAGLPLLPTAWVDAVSTAPARQGQGCGRAVLRAVAHFAAGACTIGGHQTGCGFSLKPLKFNLRVHAGDAMQVGKRNPLRAVTFAGIDFAADRQTRVIALL